MAYKSMGETIGALRREKGLTQRELADKLNVTDKAVSEWSEGIFCYIPYVPVKGSLKIPISGVRKVKMTNRKARMPGVASAGLGERRCSFSDFNRCVS